MERVMAATTLPALILGGEVAADAGRRVRAVEQGAGAAHRAGPGDRPHLLYPPGGDVADAVDRAVGLL